MAKLMMDYLDEAAMLCPEKLAYGDEHRTLTFREARAEAHRIAGGILAQGLEKQPVAIYMEKSISCITAMLGVMVSGNYYTVLDTHMPQARIQKILDTLNPALILTSEDLSEQAQILACRSKEGADGTNPEGAADCGLLLFEDCMQRDPDPDVICAARSRIIESDVLYVLFTSGSTGTPKGVVTSHRAVVRYMEAAVKPFHLSENDISGNQTPLYFVFSLLDVYGTIYNKSTVWLIPQMYFAFPALLLRFIEEKKINLLLWVPSALTMIANLKAFDLADISCITRVIFGGEVMPIKQLNQWREALPDACFINAYGPTEATDTITTYELDREFALNERLPIGTAIENCEVLVLDEEDHLVTGSGMGELCVRSDSLAYGYYGAPEKTAEVFVQNPLNPNYPEIIYRTGDLVEYNDRGELEYAGRKDFQIKHMGHRIELGEIEANVSAIDGVEENACFYNKKRQKIVLFYSGKPEAAGIKEALKQCLPDYMVPGKVVRINPMPHNLNGKVDRAALKEQI